MENKAIWKRVMGGSLIDIYECSKCHSFPPKKPIGYTWAWDFTPFCPNCGLPMSKEEDDTIYCPEDGQWIGYNG